MSFNLFSLLLTCVIWQIKDSFVSLNFTYRTILALLNNRPGTHALRHIRTTKVRRCNHMQTVNGWVDLGAVAWESFDNALVLILNIFELFKKLRCGVDSIRRWTRLSVDAFCFWFKLQTKREERRKIENLIIIMTWQDSSCLLYIFFLFSSSCKPF